MQPSVFAGTSADDLFPLFDRYGKVVDIFIPRDRRYFLYLLSCLVGDLFRGPFVYIATLALLFLFILTLFCAVDRAGQESHEALLSFDTSMRMRLRKLLSV